MANWIVLVVVIVEFVILGHGLDKGFRLLDGRLDRLEEKLEEIKRLR